MSGNELPAILGGEPEFPQGPPSWPPSWNAVQNALQLAVNDGSWGQYLGPHVESLEQDLAKFYGVPHVLTCASGTLAVEVALRAGGVGPGDEVILSAYDYESNFLTIHSLGAKPVLVDVHSTSGNLDLANLESAVTAQTRAIICSHLHGGLVPMPRVCTFAREHSVFVVEDAAQAPGAVVQERRAGSWGDAGTLSFGGSKLLSAGRGGAILFQDSRAYQRAKLWLRRGVQLWAPISELQAVVLRPQLISLETRARHRHEQVTRLRHLLTGNNICGLRLFDSDGVTGRPDYYKVGFWLESQAFGMGASLFVQAMRAEGIAFDRGFKPLHLGRSPSRFRASGSLEHATALGEMCVKIHHPILAEENPTAMERIAHALWKVYRNADRIRRALSSS